MDDDNSLQINIEAVDDASSILEGVADAAGEMADQIASAASSVNGALDSISTTATDMGGGLNASLTELNAALQGAESSGWATSVQELTDSVNGMDGATAKLTTDLETSSAEVNSWFANVADQAGVTAEEVVGDFSEITGAVSYLQTAGEDSFGGMAVASATAAGEIESNLTSAGQASNSSSLMMNAGMLLVGTTAKQIGGDLTGFYGEAVTASTGAATSLEKATTGVTDLLNEYKELKDPTSAISQEVNELNDKINVQKANIEALEVPISGAGKSIAQLSAATAQHAAEAAKDADTLQQLEGQMQQFTNMSKNAGATAAEITAIFSTQAKENENLGYTYSESLASVSSLMGITGDYKDALSANNIAMDLSRAKNIDLSTATNDLAQAFAGNGRSLQTLGIHIKDGLSGMQALGAVFDATKGQAQGFAQTAAGQFDALAAHWNQLMIYMGQSQNGPLVGILKGINDIVVAVTNWIEAHPKLTEVILLTIGALGVILVTIGSVIAFIGLLAIGITLLGGTFTVGFAAVIAATIAFAALVIGIVVAFWPQISGFFVAMWNDIKNATNEAIAWLENLLLNWTQNVEDTLSNWGKSLGSFFTSMWKDIENIFIDGINFVIDALDGLIRQVNNFLSLLQKVPGMGSVIGQIPIIPHVTAVDDAIISPSGEVITTNPNDYLIATQTPGSLIGSGPQGNGNGSIIVNINGAVWSTKDQATMLANEIARQIGRNNRLTSIK